MRRRSVACRSRPGLWRHVFAGQQWMAAGKRENKKCGFTRSQQFFSQQRQQRRPNMRNDVPSQVHMPGGATAPHSCTSLHTAHGFAGVFQQSHVRIVGPPRMLDPGSAFGNSGASQNTFAPGSWCRTVTPAEAGGQTFMLVVA